MAIIINNGTAIARTHPYYISSVAISPDSKYIAIGRLDNKLILLDRDLKKTIKVIEAKQGELNIDPVFTPDSKTLLFQNKTYDIIFYNIEQDAIIKKTHIDFEYSAIIFTKDMTQMVIGGEDGRIELRDTKTNKLIKTLKKPDKYQAFPSISHLVLSPNGKYFVSTVSADKYWDNWPQPEEDFKEVDCGGGNKIMLVKHRGVNLWDVETGVKLHQLLAPRLNGRTWACFSPDGKYVLATSENGWPCKFDVQTGEMLMEYERSSSDGIGFPDVSNRYFVTLWPFEDNSNMNLYDIEKEKRVKILPLSYDAVTGALATLPSQNLIVTGDRDGSISVYKFDPKTQSIQLEWHPKPVRSGVIRWLSPLHLMGKGREDIKSITERYEEEQKKVINQDEKQKSVETRYEKIEVK
jgi:WD40 repeat protein